MTADRPLAEEPVEVQYASALGGLPAAADLQRWAHATLARCAAAGAVVIRIVDDGEGAALNRAYRGKAGPTNVLSFPFEAPPGVPVDLLGDLVICAPVVRAEAAEQRKNEPAHWAHMVVHGCLHLLGHDHQDDREAQEMERLEREILSALGYPDPYATNEQ